MLGTYHINIASASLSFHSLGVTKQPVQTSIEPHLLPNYSYTNATSIVKTSKTAILPFLVNINEDIHFNEVEDSEISTMETVSI